MSHAVSSKVIRSPSKYFSICENLKRDLFYLQNTSMLWLHGIETLCTPTYCDNFLPDATPCASNPDDSSSPAREAIRDQRPKAVAESARSRDIVMRGAVRNRMQAPQCALHCDGYR